MSSTFTKMEAMAAGFRGLPLKVGRLAVRHAQVNWTLADQAVVSGVNFLTSLVVARFLGVEAFGVFSLAWLVLLFVQSFQQAFILTPMLSIGPKQAGADKGDYYAALLPLQVGFSILAAGAAAAVSALAGDRLGMAGTGMAVALPLGAAVVATQVHEFFRRYCFSRGCPSVALRMDVARCGAQLCALFALFWMGAGSVAGVLWVVAGCAVVGAAAMLPERLALAFKPACIADAARRHWNMSKWLVPSALMQWTSGNFFALAAGALLGPAAVGAMRAAQNLMGVTHVFFEAMHNWAPVRAARAYADQGYKGLQAFTSRLMVFTLGVTSLAVVVLALPGNFWLGLLYGPEYAPYGWLVVFYGVAYLFMAANAPYRYAFAAFEKTRPIFIGYLVATIFSLTAVYPVISNFGLAGAAFGFVGTQALLFLSYFALARVRA